MSDFLTMEQLAERWKRTPGAIYTARWRGDDLPKGVRVGKRILFPITAVEDFEAEKLEK